MKKIAFLLVAIFASVAMYANMQGHFFLNVESEDVQVSDVESHFAQWLDLPANTTFTLFRDETDNLGIRHMSFQQYVNGTIIQNGMVLVHAKNGIVNIVNGDIMDATIAAQQPIKAISPLKAAQKVRKKAAASDAQLKIVRANINGKEVFRYAYEVITDNHSAKLYVDTETGELIKRSPLVFNADVPATVMTMYSGTQAMTCVENDSLYYLHDEGRGIVTLNATDVYDPDNEYKFESIFRLQDETEKTSALFNYFSDCAEIINLSATWGGFWMMLLKNIKINNVNQNSNWYSVGEGAADVYIKIKDNTGNVVFTSERYDDATFPITFNIGMQITTPPYSIEVWDYDPFSSDDLIETIEIEKILGENKTYDHLDISSEIVSLTYRIESSGRHPFLDAHWGMEKTIDFYREKFNRNGYDNQGSVVYQLVNQPSTMFGLLAGMYTNACALGDQNPAIMVYGMGMISSKSEDITSCTNPFVSLDIMAHEFSHLVTKRNGNGGLEYQGEAGALNESFSDIMGISTKKYATDYTGWSIGNDIMIYVSNMRSMDNPNNGCDGLKPQPDTYEGSYWIEPDTTYDNGGVHTNSGVQNYWFYLLTEGGNGTNDINNTYSVTGIGIDKALQIAYRNLIYYLTPEATHEDARSGSIQAAIDLYGEDAQEHQSVANAWYAVGVGNAYTNNAEPFTLTPGKYIIVANRGKTGDKNWYYMTSDLGTASNKRFQAVSTEVENIDDIVVTELGSEYIWELEADGPNWKLKNDDQYVSWNSGNTTRFDAIGKSLTFEVEENKVQAHFNDGTNERYLSLNATTGNNYFAFYSGTSQQINLYFLPYEEEEPPVIPQPESDRYVVLARRNATSNWFYMTSDLGTASNKRYQAVDAGTSILSEVTANNLEDKYYWEIEDNKLKTGTQYSTWTYGNTANLDANGKELNIQQHTDGTYSFSFVDGADTRYLALNATTGNDYFAYYKGTNQIYRLTLIKEGEDSPTVDIKNGVVDQQSATKILHNGQILILRGDRTYTVTGQEIK